MMSRLVVVVFVLWPQLLMAEVLPAYFDVTGVEQTDVLNVRERPGTTASIIGTLAPVDRNIEVVGLDEAGEWGRINLGERSGWVSMRYLARQPGQPGDSLPRPLICAGTEPFWSLILNTDPTAELRRPAEETLSFANLYTVNSSNRTDRYAIFGEGEEGLLTAVFHRAECSDGMSDRAYGISVDMFLTDEGGVGFMSGCCSLSR